MEHAAWNRGAEFADTAEREFMAASKRIQADIAAWYQRFAANNGITLAEAKRWLNAGQLREFQWSVQDYIKAGETFGRSGQWARELENASAKVHISRLEALQIQLQQEIEVLYGNQLDGLDGLLRRVYSDGYYHTAFEIQRGFQLGWDLQSLNENQLIAALSRPWSTDGMTFRDRCWRDRAGLVQEVQTGLVQGIIRGDSPDRMTGAIAKRFAVSRGKAARLAMTESAYFSAQSQKAAFRALDVEQFEVVETLDSHTCGVCGDLDGIVIPMADYEPGVTAPPFHPWCRGCTAPWFPEDYGERAARGQDGKVYYVPANIKYSEWKKTFVGREANVEGGGVEAGGNAKQIGTVNFSNRTAVLNWLAQGEAKVQGLDHEMNFTVCADGTVWQVGGEAGVVDLTGIKGPLAGSYSYHNHPRDATWHSFSAEDAAFFLQSREAYSKASDYAFEYVMQRTEETLDAAWEDVYHRFKEIHMGDVAQMAWDGSINMDVDGYHETMCRLSREYKFIYERRPRDAAQ